MKLSEIKRSLMTPEEKAFIITKQLGSNPANGLSAKHYRQKYGLNLDTLGSKKTLQLELNRMMGGISEADANKILATNPYLQADPANIKLGKPIIDNSATNRQLMELTAKKVKNGAIPNMQPVRKRKDITPSGKIPIEQFDGEYWKSDELPTYEDINNAMGGKLRVERTKPKKPRKKSQWNLFVSKVSKWPSLQNLGGSRLTAVSMLYKAGNEHGIGEFDEFKKKPFVDFKDFEDLYYHIYK